MPEDKILTPEEAERLSAKAMDENITILQALAETDRKQNPSPQMVNVFFLNYLKEMKASVGTITGLLEVPSETQNRATVSLQMSQAEKPQSVST